MFKIEPSPTFWAKVKLTIPGEEKPGEVEMEFAHQGNDKLRAWIDAARTATSDELVLDAVVRNWRGVDAAFSPENLRALVRNYPAAGAEIFEQYLKALTESRAKN